MADLEKPTLPPQVSCEVCRKQLARSTARSAEGRDYVYYFCGGECYDKWRREHPHANDHAR